MRHAPSPHDGDFRLDRASIEAAARPVGPSVVDGHTIELRPPRLSDGPAWRRARLAAQERLSGTFGHDDATWRENCSLTTYAEQWWGGRQAWRAGLYVPFVAVVDGRDIGSEYTFSVHPRTGVCEGSMWADERLSPAAVTWIGAAGLLRVFGLPRHPGRIVAPVAVDNPGPARLLQQFGFEHHGVARRLRRHRGQIVDHDIWWLERDEDHLARLGAMIATQLV